MLRTALLCLMLNLSAGVEQRVVESISYRFGKHIRHCHTQMQMEEADLDRYIGFWSDQFDFDVWYDGCLAQCVMQRQGLLDRDGNFKEPHVIAFARSSGADDEQIRELLAMVTTQCDISELMSELPEVNQPPECVRPMLMAICFRRGILESMRPEYRRRKYDYTPNLSQLETLYSKLFQLFTF